MTAGLRNFVDPRHDPDVGYVPICLTCGKDVYLTEADDGTWEHEDEMTP